MSRPDAYPGGGMRPVLNLFYILDTSGSMRLDNKIATLNRAMRDTLEAVRQESQDNNHAQVRVAVLEFNSTCRWLNPSGPEDLERGFFYEELSAQGGTSIGAALKELDSKLSRTAFIDARRSNLMPVIIFMTDGMPTDQWEAGLDKINRNKWFMNAARIGFALGGDADQQVIARIVGGPEHVIRTQDLDDFAALLRWVSISSTMLQSQSRPGAGGNVGAEAVSDAKTRQQEARRQSGRGYTDFDADSDMNWEPEEPQEEGSWGDDPFVVKADEYDNTVTW